MTDLFPPMTLPATMPPLKSNRQHERRRISKSASADHDHVFPGQLRGGLAVFAEVASLPASQPQPEAFAFCALQDSQAPQTEELIPQIRTEPRTTAKRVKKLDTQQDSKPKASPVERFAKPHIFDAPLPNLEVAIAEPPPPEEVTYKEWFEENVLRSRWMTWFVAFYVHWLILLLLSVIYIHSEALSEHFAINASISPLDDLPTEFVELDLVEPELEIQEEETAAPTMPSVEEVFNPEPELKLSEMFKGDLPPQDTAPAPSSSASDNQNPADKPVVKAVANPAPAGAVTAGSFSVWTIPDNPDPGEPYRIVIQVRLPEGTKRYNVSDLEGVVVGSDGYRKPVPGSNRGEIPVVAGYSRFVVHVVSADEKVEDTIFIRSRILREAQKLQLRF